MELREEERTQVGAQPLWLLSPPQPGKQRSAWPNRQCLAPELKGPYAQEPSHFHGRNKYLLTNSQYLLVHSFIHLFDNTGLPW